MLKIASLAVVMARGNKPPVRSFACTEMSGAISESLSDGVLTRSESRSAERKEKEEGRPRR